MIASDAVIYPGCRIVNSSIGPGCVIGAEGPVTIENCQLGRNVRLNGGYFSGSVFLDGSGMGGGAHVRAGTILEEKASGAHTVGLKQTVLLPFVTLGSLINFCDILMAGGTSRKDHSEVGSSYIHFNFTPHQDKATASLVGDVPRGVLMNEKPIFLGGQGGLVGPAQIAYGCVIAAGGICRKDVLKENHLHVPAMPSAMTIAYDPRGERQIDLIVKKNLIYIGNIRALKVWYETVRVLFIRDPYDQAVLNGARASLDLISAERIRRLDQLIAQTPDFPKNLDLADVSFDGSDAAPAGLMRELSAADRTDYLAAVKNLSQGACVDAAAWLQRIVDETVFAMSA